MGARPFEHVFGKKPDPKALGAALRKLRESHGITVGGIAERMGWTSQNVSRLERGSGTREPTMSSVNLYLRMLGYEMTVGGRPMPAPRKTPVGRGEPEDGG
jgi:transcriptional regulator with XRE-family HTH domain